MKSFSKSFPKFFLLIAIIILFVLPSCSRTMPQTTGSTVNLSGNNYKLIKAGARGDSYGFYLFGLIPIVTTNFSEAKENLYSSLGHKLEGRSIALANQTQDSGTVYLVLFSIPNITITADVVEFNDKAHVVSAPVAQAPVDKISE